MQAQNLTLQTCKAQPHVQLIGMHCTRAHPSRLHRHSHQQLGRRCGQRQCAGAIVTSARDDTLPDDMDVLQKQHGSARESAVALLRLLQGASLLAAVGLEVGSLLRHGRLASAGRAAAQQAQAAQEEAARQATHQSGRRWGRKAAVQVAEAAPPARLQQHQGIGSYVLERGSTWGVLLALLCGALLSWLRRPRCAWQLLGWAIIHTTSAHRM